MGEFDRYRKRPVVVEAVRAAVFMGAIRSGAPHHVPQWASAAWADGTLALAAQPTRVLIRTLGGEMTASDDDWIIQGVKGELYPCKPDVFEATYERVEPETPEPEVWTVTIPTGCDFVEAFDILHRRFAQEVAAGRIAP